MPAHLTAQKSGDRVTLTPHTHTHTHTRAANTASSVNAQTGTGQQHSGLWHVTPSQYDGQAEGDVDVPRRVRGVERGEA
jgi:hypothetical protein